MKTNYLDDYLDAEDLEFKTAFLNFEDTVGKPYSDLEGFAENISILAKLVIAQHLEIARLEKRISNLESSTSHI